MATTQSLQFTDTETEQLVVYRPVNRWSVASVILGLLSVFSLLHVVFLVLPLAGLFAAIIAVRQLKGGEVPQSGEAAVKWGVFLCLTFGSTAGTQFFYGQYRIQCEAQRCGEKWLQLFREGKMYEVHQLTIEEGERAAAGASLAKHYAPRVRKFPPPAKDPSEEDPTAMMEMMQPTPEERLKEFLEAPTVSRLQKLGERAEYQFLRASGQRKSGPHEITVEAKFRVTYEEGGQSHQFDITMLMERSQPGRIAIWRVLTLTEDLTG